jgi:hypothetical protein
VCNHQDDFAAPFKHHPKGTALSSHPIDPSPLRQEPKATKVRLHTPPDVAKLARKAFAERNLPQGTADVPSLAKEFISFASQASPGEWPGGFLKVVRPEETEAAQKLIDSLAVTIKLSSVEPKKVTWLWPNTIPNGKLTLFAGSGGLGKSFFTLQIAATVSRGECWPNCPDEATEQGSVLLISTEDDAADTLVPRLISCGADRDVIHTFKPEVLDRFTLADLEKVRDALREMVNPRLIVIDPVTVHVGGVDDHKNSELRSLLSPLAALAAEFGIAVVLVTHVSKSVSPNAAHRVLGSVAYTNAVRAAWLFIKDPADRNRRLFVSIKNNLAADPKGLAYRIAGDPARVVWDGEVAIDADDAVMATLEDERKPPGKPPTKSLKDAQWLFDLLKPGPLLLAKIIDQAREARILNPEVEGQPTPSTRPIYNAKDKVTALNLGFTVEQFEAASGSGTRLYKHWRLTEVNRPKPQDCQDDAEN